MSSLSETIKGAKNGVYDYTDSWGKYIEILMYLN